MHSVDSTLTRHIPEQKDTILPRCKLEVRILINYNGCEETCLVCSLQQVQSNDTCEQFHKYPCRKFQLFINIYVFWFIRNKSVEIDVKEFRNNHKNALRVPNDPIYHLARKIRAFLSMLIEFKIPRICSFLLRTIASKIYKS